MAATTARASTPDPFRSHPLAGAIGSAPDRELVAAAAHAAPGLHPILVDDDGAAALFGVSKRTFCDLIPAPWMALPITLGPRLRRWSVDELRAAVARMPRQAARQEQPASLLRARIENMKATGRLA
ncbi:MAG TPA: hypothetical protein VF457_06105 [Burkholderiaceae bacterium]